MADRVAVLVCNKDKWVLVSDDNSPPIVWENAATALSELQNNGWRVIEGPGPVRPTSGRLRGINVLGYIVKYTIQ